MQEKDVIIRKLKLSFLQKGLSIADWCRVHDFDEKAVVKIFHRYAQNQQLPRSPFVFKVLTMLEKDTGIELMTERTEVFQ